MNFQKGQDVVALDIDREPHRMKVWRASAKSVFVATPDLFAAIEAGTTERWPVAVPREDVDLATPEISTVRSS